MPQATSLAAAIRDAVGVESELERGDNGIFDIIADGEVVFSKYAEGRFPENEEVLAKLS